MRWASLALLLGFAQQICLAQNTTLPVIRNGQAETKIEDKPVPRKPSPPGPAAPALAETIVSFDAASLQLIWSEGNWQLRAGTQLLKDFGRQETLARRMLLLIRELRLNQYGRVGQPKPVLEYWLTDGTAAQGIPTGLPTCALHQPTLRVEKVYGQWCVRDAYRMLLNFERDEESAQQAVAILKKYQFSQVGSLGIFPPTLIFLRRPGDAMQEARLESRPPLATAEVLQTMAPSLSAPLPQILTGSNDLADPRWRVGLTPAPLPQIITGSNGQSSPRSPGSGR